MADTYGVLAAQVASELPGLFPVGFSAATKPTLAQVTSLITTADVVVGLHVADTTGSAPASSDRAAPIAVRYIIEWTKAQVIRIVYTGNDPGSVANAAEPYDRLAKSLLEQLDLLAEQAVGTGEAASRVAVPTTWPTRDLVIADEDLDGNDSYRTRRF